MKRTSIMFGCSLIYLFASQVGKYGYYNINNDLIEAFILIALIWLGLELFLIVKKQKKEE